MTRPRSLDLMVIRKNHSGHTSAELQQCSYHELYSTEVQARGRAKRLATCQEVLVVKGKAKVPEGRH